MCVPSLADTIFTIKSAGMSRHIGCRPKKGDNVTSRRHVAETSPTCAAKDKNIVFHCNLLHYIQDMVHCACKTAVTLTIAHNEILAH